MRSIYFASIIAIVSCGTKNESSRTNAFHKDANGQNNGLIDVGIYVDARKTTTAWELATTQFSGTKWTGDHLINRTTSGYDEKKHLELSKDGNFYVKVKSASNTLDEQPSSIEVLSGSIINDNCETIGYEEVTIADKSVCTTIDEVVKTPRHKANTHLYLIAVKPKSGEIRVRVTWEKLNGGLPLTYDIRVANLVPKTNNPQQSPLPQTPNFNTDSTGVGSGFDYNKFDFTRNRVRDMKMSIEESQYFYQLFVTFVKNEKLFKAAIRDGYNAVPWAQYAPCATTTSGVLEHAFLKAYELTNNSKYKYYADMFGKHDKFTLTHQIARPNCLHALTASLR